MQADIENEKEAQTHSVVKPVENNEKPVETVTGEVENKQEGQLDDQGKQPEDETPTVPTWEGSFKDVTDHQRTINITQKDGKKITVVINWPGIQQAQDIADQQIAVVRLRSKETAMRETTGAYRDAMLPCFGILTIDSVPKGKLDWKLLETLEMKSVKYIFECGDTFLTSKLDAD